MTIDTTPRKRPRQARSHATVDALIEAASQVLIEHGYEGATTARVAERAGVSVGSLYQYYPNKESLVAALIERHASAFVGAIEQAFAGTVDASLEEGLRAIIRAGLDAHRIDPALHKILVEQVPRVGRMAEVMDISRRVTKSIEQLLRAHLRRLPKERDPALAALVIETTLEALTHKAVIERPELLASGKMEKEMYAILSGYLSSPPVLELRSAHGAQVPRKKKAARRTPREAGEGRDG
ncbi:TetR/AcrR family transcriptional regulator [Pendulispora albinea]|uniref:TetR/AcrR family transcriptional regulator n=1 Tax=Pendulispora albinea TaxID=2741071 RepID=A0ABZ2LWH2_9BACT